MPDPMYRQIADVLRQEIESGQVKRGGRLPTEQELQDQYGASRNTVRDAIKWLVNRGLIETRPGQGTFVAQKINPFVTKLSITPQEGDGDCVYLSESEPELRTPTAKPPRVEILRADGIVASELHLDETAQVVSRRQEQLIDGKPYSLHTDYYPMTLVTKGARDILRVDMTNSIISYIEEVLHKKRTGRRDKITMRAPDAMEAMFLQLSRGSGASVFEITRTDYDESGQPLRLTVTVYPGDRTSFILDIGDVPRSGELVRSSNSSPNDMSTWTAE